MVRDEWRSRAVHVDAKVSKYGFVWLRILLLVLFPLLLFFLYIISLMLPAIQTIWFFQNLPFPLLFRRRIFSSLETVPNTPLALIPRSTGTALPHAIHPPPIPPKPFVLYSHSIRHPLPASQAASILCTELQVAVVPP